MTGKGEEKNRYEQVTYFMAGVRDQCERPRTLNSTELEQQTWRSGQLPCDVLAVAKCLSHHLSLFWKHFKNVIIIFFKCRCNRPWRPIGLWEVEAPTSSRQSTHRWRWDCQPYAPTALYQPGKFLVLISVRGWVDPRAIVRLEGLFQLKNPVTSSGFDPATYRLLA
jgi:hypothetical protein